MVITLLTRSGCNACARAQSVLEAFIVDARLQRPELRFTVTDVDAAAVDDPELRAEYGDRLPVVLLDGAEHGYWEVDEPRLRRDLGL